MAKTILITGGAGFIGGTFVRYLRAKYPAYRLIVVDALTYAGSVQNNGSSPFDSTQYEFWHGDVRNGEMMDTLVGKSDVVVHMAAESHVTRSIYDNKLFFDTDVMGTQAVASAVVKHRDRIERFLHISTSEVYGTAESATMSEEHPLNPLSPYASAKAGADRLVYSYWKTYQVPAIIVRPFNNYGPQQHLEKVIPRFVTSCLLGEPLTVHGDGSAARDFLFVDDHCEALDLLIHADRDRVAGEAVNIGSGTHVTILEIAERIRSLLGSPAASPIEFVGDRPGQVFRQTAGVAKVRRLLDWQPKTDFEDGLRRTIRWYDEHRDWWRPQMWMRHVPIVTASGKREMH